MGNYCCGFNTHKKHPLPDLQLNVEIIVDSQPPEDNIPVVSVQAINPDYDLCKLQRLFPLSTITVNQAKIAHFNSNHRSIIQICHENSEISTDDLSMISRFREILEKFNENGIESLKFQEPKQLKLKSKSKILKCASSAIIEFDNKVDFQKRKLKLKKIYFSWSQGQLQDCLQVQGAYFKTIGILANKK